MYCVSLDPGGTTGVCLVPNRSRPWQLRVEQIAIPNHHRHLLNHLALWKPSVIVCEDFISYGNDAAVLISAEYIGVVKAYAQSHADVHLVMQQAWLKDQFWTDKKLREHNLYAVGQKHARDACCHYLYYRTFKLNDTTLLKDPKLGKLTATPTR
jgi:hypothetical protein